MPELDLSSGLRALAEREAATPEGRERLVAALQETLAAMRSPPPTRPPEFISDGVSVAVAALHEHLVGAADHVDFLREVMASAPPR